MSEHTVEKDALPKDVRKVLEGFTICLTFGLAAIVYAIRDKGRPLSESVRLIGGRYDGLRVDLLHSPPRIDVGGIIYERIDDPDTGESLGGYFTHA